MANTLLLRGGTTQEVAAATLAEREVMVDTTTDQLVVGPSKNYMAVGSNSTFTGTSTFTGDVLFQTGVTFGTGINANSLRIKNVATPTSPSDAANKSYVDAEITNLSNTLLSGNITSIDNTIDITESSGTVDLSVADGAITTAKIAADAVTDAQIANNAVTSDQIQGGAVTNTKLANFAVTTAKIAEDAITTNRIADKAVTADKLADGSISGLVLGTDSVSTDKIQNGAVTTGKLAPFAVDSTKINDSSITEAKIVTGAVSTVKIADDAVTTAKIADAAVTSAKLDPSILTTHASQVTAAQNAATAAASSAASALAAFDSFDDTYLGAKASDPSTDNDGDPLNAGDLYFNTTDEVMRLYTGTQWVTAYVPGEATNISYDNASSGLTASNVQAAINELDSTVDSLDSVVDDALSGVVNANPVFWNRSGTTVYPINEGDGAVADVLSSFPTTATNYALNVFDGTTAEGRTKLAVSNTGVVKIGDRIELGDVSITLNPNGDATFDGNITVTGDVDGRDVSVDGAKLDGIEAGATADQTSAEIKASYESNNDTNAFTDAEKTKLAGIETGATGDQTAAEIKTAYESNNNTNAFTDAEQTKLSGIETGATADQTGAEIKTAYEGEADTNAFTDAEKTKLAGIAAGAQVNVDTDLSYTASTRVLTSSTGTDATLPEVVASGDSGLMTGVDKTKLDGIETGATADQDASEVSYDPATSGMTATDLQDAIDELDNRLDNSANTGTSGPVFWSRSGTTVSPINSGDDVSVNGDISVTGTVDGRDLSVDGSKLDGIESGATADQTAAEIKTAYESNTDTNAFTDAEKTKLSGLTAGGEPNVQSDWNATSGDALILNKPTIPTNNNQLTNGAGYITSAPATNLSVSTTTTSNTIASSTGTNATLNEATGTAAGLMSTAHHNKLDGIAAGAEVNVQADWNASSGDAFILNKPTIPTNNNQLTNGAGYITSANGGNAGLLDGIDSSQFLRSDANDTATGAITFTNFFNQLSGHWYSGFYSGTTNYIHLYPSAHSGSASSTFIRAWNGSSSDVFRITGGSSTGLSWRGNTIWTAENDGAGSGLDADTVDGIQASNFVRSDVDDTKSGQLVITGSGQYVGNYGYSTLVLQDSGGYPGIDFRSGTKDWLQRMESGTNMQWVYRNNGNYTERMELTTGGVLTVNGNTVWHAGNDGSGSGLDADTVDGIQGGSFLRSDTADTTTGKITSTAGDQAFVSQHNGNTSTWRGRILVKNSTSNKSSFLGTYASIAGVFAHNNALSAWADLYVNTVDGSTGGTVRMPSSVLVNGSQVWHAGNDGSGSGLDADRLDGQQGSYYLDYNNLTNVPSGSSNANTLDNLDSTQFLRSDVNDTLGGVLSYTSNDARLQFSTIYLPPGGGGGGAGDGDGPANPVNTSLYIGGWTSSSSNYISRIRNNGPNLHIDSAANGNLYLNTYAAGRNVYIRNGLAWHSGNDGSGSGLDADTLDGVQASKFLRSDVADQKTSGTLRFNDNIILSYGNSDDVEFFFNGSNFYMDVNAGYPGGIFYIRSGGSDRYTFYTANGNMVIFGYLTEYSDISLKENIEVIPNALDKVSKIRGITYNRNDLEDDTRYAGVIAQEVEEVLPEVVLDNEDGIKSVAYGNMVPLLIEAIKEQQATIETLTKRIEVLEGDN
jgi:hypothetical protein